MRFRLRLYLFAGLSILMLGLWAFWIEPASLRVTEYDVPLLRWPAAQNGLRIAAISDIHAGAPFIDTAKLEKIVAMSNAAHPDLVLLAGDYVVEDGAERMPGGHYFPPEDSARILAGLQAPLGVYAVLGNHDWNEPQRVSAAFEHNGIRLLDERVLHITRGRFDFWLAGLGQFPEGNPKVGKTLAGVADTAPILAFTHNPVLFDRLPQRVNLLIAGHTHGGQVDLPYWGRLALHLIGDSPSAYEAGHYRKQTDLFVTTGIGTSHLGVRFRVPPEISLLTLHQAP